ncbi:MAG: CHRD domain-containing protein, partial [Ferruginibacter sp.]
MQHLYKNRCLHFFIQAVKTVTVLFFIAMLPASAFAQNYTPNTFTDPVFTSVNNANGAIILPAGNAGMISLRSSLFSADFLGGTHIVTLGTGTYNLTQALPNRQITFGNTAQTITINGNGPANTIINMVGDANKDRIFFINPVGTTDNVITNVSGIRFQNGSLTSDIYGGAGICAGGGLGNALTVTNCAFDNNFIPINSFGGAAVCMQVSGDLTVDNSTFTNNISNDADGGAILFIIFNNNPPGYDGDLIVTNSTFTGNSVNIPGVSNSNGGALAFTGQGGIVGTFNVTINNNTFTNNTADGYGGAISANNSPNKSTSQIHFNRFVGNTSSTSATTSGMLFVNSAGSVNADNNWWGCNTGPTAAGTCDKAAGVGAPAGGSLVMTKWLQLKTTASPNPICNTAAGLGNTSVVTTSFLSNSASEAIPVANLTRLIALPVTWGPTTLGTLSVQQATIQASGTATATFTSNGTGGSATVNTQVDNVPVADLVARATITVNTLPIVTDPVNFTSCVGGTATFTSTITGTPAPTITWRIGAVALVNGIQGSGSTVSGQGTNTLTITNVQPGDAATNYNVQAVNQCGTATSVDATLFVNQVTGGTVGSDQTICSGGDPAAFTESVASTGSGALTYQWQSSIVSCVAGFGNIGGATGNTYDPPSGLAVATFYRRVTISTLNAVPCTAIGNCITITINNVTGGTVGSDQAFCFTGDPAAFTQSVASTGSGALTYQWESSTTSCVAGFSPIGGATATTYDPPSGLLVTTFYRRVTTSTLNTVPCTANSNCITVTINPLPVVSITGPNSICAACAPGPGTTIYTAALNGPAESPSNASPGTGTATITINTVTNTMRVQCTFSGLTGTTTASHIHSATAVANTGTAGVATTTPTFTGFPSGVTSGTYDNTFDMTLAGSYNPAYVTANGGTPASAFTALQAGLAANKAYFNIHSTTFPGGEIRGFLSTFCSSANSSTTLSPTSGGTWISNNPAVATVTNAGVVNGVSPGSATFTFTSTATT